jgi:S-DNA-T family DNA segregation ATPase FtsK/SpoIIIE
MPAYASGGPGSPESDRESPGALLWLALCIAPSEGASVAELMSASGMNRTTLYRHLTDHQRAGRAIQVSRGRWRAATTEGPDTGR